MNKNVNNLIEDLKNTFSEKLISVILYGSAASQDYLEKVSDINLIVVINELNAKDLKLANPAVEKWVKTKNPVPIFMGKDEWFNSCDVYAIECSDVKDRHKILYGEDIVSSIEIKKCNLRLQCESEIKNILIKLRQSYLVNAKNTKSIEELIKLASKSIFAVFRAVLRINNINVPAKNSEVIDSLNNLIEFDTEIFKYILLQKELKHGFPKDQIESIIQKMIDSLNKILSYVDKLETNI